MKIAVGSDHAGFELKKAVVAWLAEQGHEAIDVGTDSPESCDYPDFAADVSNLVSRGQADFGVMVCKTGVGSCISANKVPGIRAAKTANLDEAFLCRDHNDANVLCLGQDTVDRELSLAMLEKFLTTPFSGAERHQRRIAKISELERRAACKE
jgi:ribose 5-phosphate isomerase B